MAGAVAACATDDSSRPSRAPAAPAGTSIAPPGDIPGLATSPDEPLAAEAPEISSALALVTFDAVWTRIHETDFDPTHGGVDWMALREEFRPQAESCRSNRELRRVLSEMIARLERSHFGIIPRELADREAPHRASRRSSSRSGAADASGAHVHQEGCDHAHHDHAHGDPSEPPSDDGARGVSPSDDPDDADDADDADDDGESPEGDEEPGDDFNSFGLSLRIVQGRPVVVAVEDDSPAFRAGVQPGWELIEIDGSNPQTLIEEAREIGGNHARYAAEAFVASLDMGSSRRRVPLTFVDLDGQEHRLRLRREPGQAEIVKIGSLPPMVSSTEWRWLSEEELARSGASDLRIGLVRFTVWMPAAIQGIDQAIDALRDADGIILDLRGNPGGFAGMVMGIGGHFVTEPVSIGTMTTRETSLEFRLNPRWATQDGRSVKPITAPLAILIDLLSASTSEVFAGGLQDIGRARVFGETSAGAVLPAQLHRLPNGDLLLHAFADFRVPSGAQLEGTGVVPDEPVTLTRHLIAHTGDPVLIEAARWIRQAARPVP